MLQIYLKSFFLLSGWSCCFCTIITVGLMLSGRDHNLDKTHLKSPVDIALDRVHGLVNSGDYMNFSINYVLKETNPICTPTVFNDAGGKSVELYLYDNVAAFFGPPCIFHTALTADLAAYWNIPVIVGAAVTDILEDKNRYVTLTRSAYLSKAFAIFLKRVFEYFRWKQCAIIKDHLISYHNVITLPDILNVFEKSGILTNVFATNGSMAIRHFLRKVEEEARVIIVALRGEQVREVMIAAHKIGLINGDYVFISIEPFRNEYYFGNQEWKQGDAYDEIAKKAYEALMTIRLFEPNTKEYFDFQDELRRRETEIYNRTRRSPKDRNLFANAFYDAVILYSLAVNETLAEGGDIRDGHTLTRKMWNRTFEGISGSVTVNANGDRDANYVLWDMTDTENGTFHEIFDYYGTTDVLVPSTVNKPKWPGGRREPPPDAPFCGFQNENPACNEKSNETRSILITVAITFLCMVIVSSLVLYFVARRMSLNAELMKMSWMIKWDDLVFENLKQSTLSHSMSIRELSTGGTEHGGRVNETVAYFQGRLVFIAKVKKDKIVMNRNVLVELRNMRQLEHTNLVRFIGACVDQPNIAIIQEFCTKGSLEDILHNDDLKLDSTFKYSLINDIIQGLHYIHSSNIGIHGYLTSETCFVDSRFVLKLGFHGLHLFRKDERIERTDSKQMFRLLWSSPEALRSETKLVTKESDIYSAGIIITEIVTRLEPFETERNTTGLPKILEKIKEGGHPPFRQVISDTEVNPNIITLIDKCVDERPEFRPNTAAMMTHMRKINKNIKGGSNLLDNLLARMEQYANNLEKLVEERTAAFLEEKKKAETLLYEVLPKTVADQLKHGQSVKPEDYESVTIFFSDIVGFTSMSALSTPMQVVAFLNDLYTCFDGILVNFDVYKVETIGDAYMVVSGLPIRNGDAHAREIANMSLVLIDACSNFKIRHFPERKLLLRVGIHTGSCVAGVVGLKMPRYCLFGDTVNTASRMESNGEALKIHTSKSTQIVLEKLGGFKFECRGEVDLKGKGLQTTFWLLSSKTKPEKLKLCVPKISSDGKDIPKPQRIEVKEA